MLEKGGSIVKENDDNKNALQVAIDNDNRLYKNYENRMNLVYQVSAMREDISPL